MAEKIERYEDTVNRVKELTYTKVKPIVSLHNHKHHPDSCNCGNTRGSCRTCQMVLTWAQTFAGLEILLHNLMTCQLLENCPHKDRTELDWTNSILKEVGWMNFPTDTHIGPTDAATTDKQYSPQDLPLHKGGMYAPTIPPCVVCSKLCTGRVGGVAVCFNCYETGKFKEWQDEINAKPTT